MTETTAHIFIGKTQEAFGRMLNWLANPEETANGLRTFADINDFVYEGGFARFGHKLVSFYGPEVNVRTFANQQFKKSVWDHVAESFPDGTGFVIFLRETNSEKLVVHTVHTISNNKD